MAQVAATYARFSKIKKYSNFKKYLLKNDMGEIIFEFMIFFIIIIKSFFFRKKTTILKIYNI